MKKFVLLSLLALVSCGPSNPDAQSDVSWGKLRGAEKTFSDARTLLVCGDSRLLDVAASTIQEWDAARGRAHKLSKSEDCGERERFDGSLAVGFDVCEPPVVGFHTQEGNHHDVSLCEGLEAPYWKQVLLHETGHAFGLCDQYSERDASKIRFHGNCSFWRRSLFPARSIMGGLYPGSPSELTADDVSGIRALQK